MKSIVLAAAAVLFPLTSLALVPADIPGVPKDLTVGPPQGVVQKSLERKRALAVTAPTITVEQLFNWAEVTYPTLFPKGPLSQRLTYLGVAYTVRVYGNGNALGVTSTNVVQGIGVFTKDVLTTFGNLADFVCQVTPAACGGGGAVGPGTYSVSATTGHVFLPNYKNGKMTWLGAAGATEGAEVAPADITALRFNSNRRGWGNEAQTSTPPAADGTLAVTGTCNRDRGLPTVVTKSQELWPDFSANGYQLAGDLNPHLVFGQIEYGGYQPASVSVIREADNSVTLVASFEADCLFGFGKNNQLTKLDPAQPLQFAWHGDHAGANRGPGWGIGPGAAAPTTKVTYLGYDKVAGKFSLRFTGMACTDRGDITVYRAKSVSADGKTVVYDPGADNFGAGWLIVPKKDDANPIWQAGSGVTFDPEKFQIAWDLPLCTQK